MSIESRNPADGELLETFESSSDEEVDRAATRAHDAFRAWRRRPIADRATVLRAAGELLRKGAATFARTMALEMGKPIGEGKAEAEKCAATCDYYAANAERLLAPQPHESDATTSYVSFEPLGVVFAVMPWNYPFWQVFRFAAPVLMAGNGALLKHAPNVTRCALHIEQIFRDARLPEGLFGVVHGGAEVASRAIAHPNVVAVHDVTATHLTDPRMLFVPAGDVVGSAVATHPASSQASQHEFTRHIEVEHDVDRSMTGDFIERLGLWHRTRKTIEDVTATRRVLLVESLADDAHHDLVADEPAVMDHCLGDTTKFGSFTDGGAQHVTSRDVRHDVMPREADTLRSFARALAAEQNEPGARDHDDLAQPCVTPIRHMTESTPARRPHFRKPS